MKPSEPVLSENRQDDSIDGLSVQVDLKSVNGKRQQSDQKVISRSAIKGAFDMLDSL